MILNPAQIYQLRMGSPKTPANFGGDSDSDSSTRTTNNTTNNVNNTDKRAVASDSAISLTGDNATIDRSSSNLTQFFDSSNRSTSSLTSFMDQSMKTDNRNSSTNFTDNSLKSTNTNTTTTVTASDYGSVSGALSLADSMTSRAFGLADGAVGGSLDILKLTTSTNAATTKQAFDFAVKQTATSAAVLGFASDTIKQTGAAFQEASDSGQSKMVVTALLIVGAVGVAFALR